MQLRFVLCRPERVRLSTNARLLVVIWSLLFGVIVASTSGARGSSIDSPNTVLPVSPPVSFHAPTQVRPLTPSAAAAGSPREAPLLSSAGRKLRPLTIPRTTDSPGTLGASPAVTSLGGGGGWNTLFREGFEASFPETNNWRVPPPRVSEAQYRWDEEPFDPHGGSNSGWCAGWTIDGTGQLDPAVDTYRHGMLTWMIWGPFSATDATVAELDFWHWVDTTPGDSLFFGASTDEINFLGYFVSGSFREWTEETIDIAKIVGPLGGAPEIWIAFVFFSDQTGPLTKGVFLDDIVLRKLRPGPNCDLSVESLQFGSTRIGVPVDRTFRIKNSGTETLTGTIDVPCTAFSVVEGNAYSVSPNDSLQRTVRFIPTNPTLQSCTLDLGQDLCSDLACEGRGIANQAPTLQHQPTLQAVTGNPVEISATASDLEGPLTVRLHYRRGGDEAFTEVLMSGAGSDFSTTIPAVQNTLRGLEYYVSATDGETQVVDPANPTVAPHRIETSSASITSPNAQPGGDALDAYRLISAPGQREGASVEQLLIDDLGEYDDEEWRFFRYDGGANHEYPDPRAASIEAGRAYWLIVREPGRRLDLSGSRSFPTATSFTLPLAPGWNDVGNPFFFSVPVVSTRVLGGVADGPYAYGGSWIAPNRVSQLDPWTGYAYFNPGAVPVSLVLEPRAVDAAMLHPADSNVRSSPGPISRSGTRLLPDWSLRLSLRAGDAEDNGNELGLSQDATTGKDWFDFVEPRGIGSFVSLSFVPQSTELGPDWMTDFRPADGFAQRWVARVSTNIAGPLQLSAQEMGLLPEGFVLRVFESANGRPLDLSRSEPMTIENGASFVLLAGRPEDLDAMELARWPDAFTLLADPNPVRRSADVSLRLARATHVDVGVWDVVGRRCATVYSGFLLVGAHAWTWDPTAELPSGLYWIRARAGAEERVRKLLLLR